MMRIEPLMISGQPRMPPIAGQVPADLWETVIRAAAAKNMLPRAWLTRAMEAQIDRDWAEVPQGWEKAHGMKRIPGFIYVIGSLDQPRMKVGISKSPRDRLKSLHRIYGGPLGLFHMRAAADYWRVEQKAHALLADSCIRGEWFAVDAGTAIAAVREAIGQTSPSIPSEA